MHVKAFLHNLLSPVIHKLRCNVLAEMVLGLIACKKLQLTAIGRSLKSDISEKSGIHKVNRFLGNEFFQKENKVIYKEFAHVLIGSKTRPWIIVDWTKLPNGNQYSLRAGLAAEGRTLTLYEEVHPKEDESKPNVHKFFLRKLKTILPKGCKPIIVTDAGFKTPWFKEVLSLKWDYVGRLRGETYYKSEDDADYFKFNHLYQRATTEPQYLGEKILTKKNKMKTHFYIVGQKNKGRKSLTKKGDVKKHKDSIAYSRSYREPWLLASSLYGYSAAKKVVAIYKKRMTIEEAFRDMKSSKYGFGMDQNKTIKPERLITWLLLNMIASFLSWCVGREAERLGMQHQYQANSIKNRRVLSYFYLGCQIIRKTGKLLIPPLKRIEFEDFLELTLC